MESQKILLLITVADSPNGCGYFIANEIELGQVFTSRLIIVINRRLGLRTGPADLTICVSLHECFM